MSRHVYQNVAKDGNGAVIPSATVTPYLANTTTAVSIYTASSGGSPVNTVTTESTNGSFLFYVDDADYDGDQLFDITVSKTNYQPYTVQDVRLFTHISWVDVRDEGAKGDGVTDDTAAIQVALDAANASSPNKEVHFPAGVYLVSSSLTGYSDIKISGVMAGNGISIIQIHDDMSIGDYVFDLLTLSRVFMENLTIRSGNTQTSSDTHYQDVHGIKLYSPNRCRFSNIFIQGLDIGLDMRQTSSQPSPDNVYFDNPVFEKCKTGAIVNGQDITFNHPTFELNEVGCIIGEHLDDTYNKSIRMYGPHFETNYAAGLWVANCRDFSMRDTYAYFSNIYLSSSAVNSVVDHFEGASCDIIDNGIATTRRDYGSTRIGATDADDFTNREGGSSPLDYQRGDMLWRSLITNGDMYSSYTSNYTAVNATLTFQDDSVETLYGPGAVRFYSTSGTGVIYDTISDVAATEEYLVRVVYTCLDSTKWCKIQVTDTSDVEVAISPELSTASEPNAPYLPKEYRMVVRIPAATTSVRVKLLSNDLDTGKGVVVHKFDFIKSILTHGSFDGGFTGNIANSWTEVSGVNAAVAGEEATTVRTDKSWKIVVDATTFSVKHATVPVVEGQHYLLGGTIWSTSTTDNVAIELRIQDTNRRRPIRAIQGNKEWDNHPTVNPSSGFYFLPFSTIVRANKSSIDDLVVFGSNLTSGDTLFLDDFYMIPLTGETTFTRTTEKKASSKTALDLSGAASSTSIMVADADFTLRRATVIYDEATSVDAGVAVSVGVRRGGANSNAYFATVTSEVSKAIFDTTALSVTNTDIRKGDVLYVYNAGSKTGTGTVLVELEYE